MGLNHGELLVHFLAFVQRHNAKAEWKPTKKSKGRHVTDCTRR